MPQQFSLSWLSDPEVFQVNRLPAHASFTPDVLGDCHSIDLNGSWYFQYATSPAMVNWAFKDADFDVTGWEMIAVPSEMQLEGYGHPQYVNTMYPWDGEEALTPPDIPERFNPVGLYCRYITLDTLAPRSFISFQGVESAFALYVNGSFVGYSEDSFTPSDFELTGLLKKGVNKIAVIVFRFSSGSWLEDQDFFRFSGIMRDVFMYTSGSARIRDFAVKTDVDPEKMSASVSIDIIVENASGMSISAAIEAPDGKELISFPCYTDGPSVAYVKGLTLWSAENPYLYTLTLTLLGEGGVTERIRSKIGFRRTEIKNGLWLINGKRLEIYGVNRHDASHLHGRSVTREEMLWDITQMKRHNINALRTCHYPNQSYLYELCDEYGLYVLDETNLETHGTWRYDIDSIDTALPGDKPEWRNAVVDRVNSMVIRDRNHPCVIGWSLGNESYYGENFRHMRARIRELDSVTPIHYEGVSAWKEHTDVSDVTSYMYRKAAQLEEQLNQPLDKPIILCEYSHAMGNSCGAIHKYVELMRKYPKYQGGFIWDFIDQAFELRDAYGKSYMGYGGDFGDRPNDGNFCGDGIVLADRRLTPKMQLVKNQYQPVIITPDKDGVTIENRLLFTDLSAFNFAASWAVDGEAVREEYISVDVKPGKTRRFPLPAFDTNLSGEAVVTVSMRQKDAKKWAQSGYELAFGQAVIKKADTPAPRERSHMRVARTSGNIGVYTDGLSCMFSKLFGLISLKIGGKETLVTPPKPNFWRAPTDNDVGNHLSYRAATWKTAGQYAELKKDWVVKQSKDSVTVRYIYSLPTIKETVCEIIYTVSNDATLHTELVYKGRKGLPDMPEFSLMAFIMSKYHNVRWYGFGKEDTYEDTVQGARLGLFETTTYECFTDYLKPQECGNREGVRFMELLDDKGRGMRILCDTPLAVSALPYTPNELEEARHPNELPNSSRTVLRISARKMGVGGDDSWGAPVHPEYLIHSDEDIRFGFTIEQA